jgi:hypothetical protein
MSHKEFQDEFLVNYLKFGLGSMPKSDIDALVMSLKRDALKRAP